MGEGIIKTKPNTTQPNTTQQNKTKKKEVLRGGSMQISGLSGKPVTQPNISMTMKK
jgi:hypothetical protein